MVCVQTSDDVTAKCAVFLAVELVLVAFHLDRVLMFFFVGHLCDPGGDGSEALTPCQFFLFRHGCALVAEFAVGLFGQDINARFFFPVAAGECFVEQSSAFAGDVLKVWI